MANNNEEPWDWREACQRQQIYMRNMQEQMNKIQQTLQTSTMRWQNERREGSESDTDFDNRSLLARWNMLPQNQGDMSRWDQGIKVDVSLRVDYNPRNS